MAHLVSVDIAKAESNFDEYKKMSTLLLTLRETMESLINPYVSLRNIPDQTLQPFVLDVLEEIRTAVRINRKGVELFNQFEDMMQGLRDMIDVSGIINQLEEMIESLSRTDVVELASSVPAISKKRLSGTHRRHVDPIGQSQMPEFDSPPESMIQTSTVSFNAKRLTKEQKRAISRKALGGWKRQFYQTTDLESSGGRLGKKRKSRSTPANLYY